MACSDTLSLPQLPQGINFSMTQKTDKCKVWLQQLKRNTTVFRARVFRFLSRCSLCLRSSELLRRV